MLPINLRVKLGIALIVYFILILLFLKRRAIELKYTLLWLLAGVCMAILLVFPYTLLTILRILGITDNMNGLFVICIGFLMILCMALTSIVSRQAGKIRRLSQEIAIIERELSETKGNPSESSDSHTYLSI